MKVYSLYWDDLLEKEMAIHSSILSFLENSTDKGAQLATAHGITESDMTEATQHTRTHGQDMFCIFQVMINILNFA